ILEVELDTPVSGSVQLTVSFVPTNFKRQHSFPLLLPTPQQARSTGGLVAYLTDLPTRPDDNLAISITKIEPEAFAKAWSDLRLGNPANPQHPYHSQRFSPKTLAGLRAPPNGAEPRFAQDIRWKLHPNYAALNATLTLEDCPGSTYVEWEVPAGLTV